jgi:hypothetical protein
MRAFKLALFLRLIQQQRPLWELPSDPFGTEAWITPRPSQFSTATTEYNEVSQ